MDTRIPNRPRAQRPRPALALLALLLALLVVSACLAGGAGARPARTRHVSCAGSRRAKHQSAKHCAKRKAAKTVHKGKKPAPKAAPTAKLTPATCEDRTAPVHAPNGEYTCEDGSEPACQDGSEPVRPSASSAPMCHVSREAPSCALGAGSECSLEFACEEEATEGPQGCERGSAFEEEEIEA